MYECLLYQLVKRGDVALLVHAEGWRIQGQVDFHSAVGGAQVTSPNMETTHHGKGCGAAEHVVAPGGSMGLLG